MSNEQKLFNYGVQLLYAGGTAPYSPEFESITVAPLQGLQSANLTLAWPRQDVVSWDGCGDAQMVTRPRAELDFSYIIASGVNERAIGLSVNEGGSVSALSDINSERNYYLLINEENQDLIGYQGWNNRVMGVGNAVLTRYSFSAAVGQFSTVEASAEALNLLIQPSGTGQPLPSIFKQNASAPTGRYSLPLGSQTVSDYNVAAPSNIILSFATGSAFGTSLSGAVSCPVQSFNFSVDIPRTEVKDLGWALPNERPVQWPVTVNITAEATLNGLQSDALNRFNCPDSGWDFSVGFKKSCIETDILSFAFAGAKLTNQRFISRIGPSSQVSFNWTMRVFDVARLSPNFYIHSAPASYLSIVFPQVNYVDGVGPLVFTLSEICFLSLVSGPAILNGNTVTLSEAAGTVVIRATPILGGAPQDLTVVIS